MSAPAYLAITGGIGGAKLSLGLAKLLGGDELAFIVNTGDDFRHLGLHISPDVDTLVYTLADEVNPDTGWGRRDESWQFMEALGALGGETWFQLGDKDLAMHIERTQSLEAGQTLSQVTRALARAFGIAYRILPMSDDPVRTSVITAQGAMDFQHYFVRDKCEPEVSGFEFEGAETAKLNAELSQWLSSPALKGVILCPSNPFVSIDPILSVPGLREKLAASAAPVIAVSPVIGGAAIKGPTVKMMRELKVPNSAEWVAGYYSDFLDGFILDSADEALMQAVEALGLKAMATNTLMLTLDDRVQLAQDCLEFVNRLN